MKSEVYKRDELLALILVAAARIKECEAQLSSDEQHAIFAHELQSALRLTMGFAKMYCDP
jgi:hypothetical protein